MSSSRSRGLPPGDYAYLPNGAGLNPALVLNRGWLLSRVAAFEPFRGTSVKTVRTRRLIPVEEGNKLIAFREDPMAVLHMHGDQEKAA